jgi:adenylylsulfate kinase
MSSELPVEKRIGLSQREVLNGHRAFALWLTGLSASGKSTLARALERELYERSLRCYVLDGDDMRHGLSRDLGFSPQDRAENIRRAGHVARLLVDAGVIVVTSFISPYRADRDQVRSLFPENSFYEVFLDCSLEICEQRDPKGLYRRAREGDLKEFTGITAPYEPPLMPDLVLPTGRMNVEESLGTLLRFTLERGKMGNVG